MHSGILHNSEISVGSEVTGSWAQEKVVGLPMATAPGSLSKPKINMFGILHHSCVKLF